MRGTLEERFWPKVDIRGEDECWPWLGSIIPRGYGRIGLGGRGTGYDYAHRVSYRLAYGDESLEPGMLVLHRCDNPSCVNPRHLFKGTAQDNFDDMRQKGRERRKVKYPREIVAQIRMLGAFMSADELATRFSLSKSHVRKILRNETRRKG